MDRRTIYPSFSRREKEGGPPLDILYISVCIFRISRYRKEKTKSGRWVVPYATKERSCKLMSMKPTVSRRSRTHVENSPPSDNLCCYINFLARNILFSSNCKTKDGPPLFEERYHQTATLFS